LDTVSAVAENAVSESIEKGPLAEEDGMEI